MQCTQIHACTPDSPLPNPHMYMYLTSHKQSHATRTLDIHVCTLLPQVNFMVHVTSVPWLITILLIFCSPAAAWIYISHQVALWWIFHLSMVFCTVFWPFKYHYWKHSGYFKYIHIVMVAVALIVPIIPVVICYKTGGYVLYFLIRPDCVARNTQAAFYSHVVPLIAAVAIGLYLLVLIFWKFFSEVYTCTCTYMTHTLTSRGRRCNCRANPMETLASTSLALGRTIFRVSFALMT